MASASSIARRIEPTVLSMLTTTPLRRPLLGCVPMPMMSMPSSEISPTMAQIFVVPISRPTTISPPFCFAIDALRLFRRWGNLNGDPVGSHAVVEPDDLGGQLAALKLFANSSEALELGG